MRRMMAAYFSRVSVIPSPRRARSFTELPDFGKDLKLLTELAIFPSEFSPASASLPLALCGGGSVGRMAHDFLSAVGLDIVVGCASQLSQPRQMSVTTRPLDALGFSPTFLKLHLVYHNADGIWKTPLWLMETLPEYRFLFRAHSWCGTGAVIYAIPNERCVQ
jgi:hypothetical protein